jgi:hypothetical protein
MPRLNIVGLARVAIGRISPEMKNTNSGAGLWSAPVPAGFARIFDIVNGFLIDAATHLCVDPLDRQAMRRTIWLRLIRPHL